MPFVSPSEAEFATVTRALVPLNISELPDLPDVLQVAPLIVPLLLLPEISLTVVPAPSLKAYAATRPPVTCVLATVTVTLVVVVVFPAASRARAESVCAPLPADVVFQASEYGPV